MTTKTFHDYNIQADLCDALADLDIIEPFPIQELTLPVALEGHDVIGHARTGSGKTLGFGLPLLNRIDRSRREVQALVVTPTRELCLQVTGDFEQAAKNTDIQIMPIYGGVPIEPQTQQLHDGVHVVVGTPGRLLDHVRRGNLELGTCRIVVLDEADEMLDMGFLPDVEQLLAKCSDDRHTMLFSATMPTAVVNLARTYMDRPTFIRAEIEEHTIPDLMEQHFFLVHKLDKPRILARILQTPERGLAVVFTRTKAMADRLVDDLRGYEIDAVAIHGDLRQATREKNLGKFRSETNRADVLVATEVAARGLDIDLLTHVINYDPPEDEKMYLHRIGRTARAGGKGVAITFATFAEIDRLNATRKALDLAKDPIEEVFSTSDKLQELFDLPDETPWAHLSRSSKGSRGKSSGSSRSASSKSDDDRASSKGGSGRGSRSKGDTGRSRSGGSRAEQGGSSGRGKRSGSREQRGGDDTSSSRGTQDTGREVASSDDASSGLTDEAPARARTRTRSRGSSSSSRSSGGSSSDRSSSRSGRADGSSGDGPSEGRSRDGDGERKTSGSGSGRVRARGGRKSSDGGSGGVEQDRPSAARDADDAGGHRSSDRSEGAERRGGGRSDGPDRGKSSVRSRSGNGSGGRGPASKDDRSSNGNGRTPDGPTATAPGADARGEGQPGIVREVKVEHLP